MSLTTTNSMVGDMSLCITADYPIMYFKIIMMLLKVYSPSKTSKIAFMKCTNHINNVIILFH